ncbi:hypothetical protein [Actinoplanes couchii]|uniref:BP74 N-terminal domain-containing protein n=1 Tax=Actinoplanes couchii TaxID=403638 RepID=A0ABQ3XEL6_9ACTN|nr:hypothetical protein [Actinoplanes couchii]MDR6319817.1 site-specific recombinase [Actinoplanes couchii]GID56952.1 hypothetical protein Aco03nite_053560 [Actinoplanes couchii]
MQTLRSRIGRVVTAAALAVAGGMLAVPVAAQAEESALFEFTDQQQRDTFVIKLTNPDRIAEARRILSGEEQRRTHVMGRFIKRPADYNPRWGFQYDPDTIQFFEVAIEVCDSSIQYLEDHLDEAGGAFLPGYFWCPWASKLTREIK